MRHDLTWPASIRSIVLAQVLLLLVVFGLPAVAQDKTIMPDLKALGDGNGGTIPAGATVKWVENAKGKPALQIQSKDDDTVIVLDRIQLTNGVVEFDALGQSTPPQSSFLGFAFRVVDAKSHDAVYFRLGGYIANLRITPSN